MVLALDRGCIMDGVGECSGLLDAHHVIYQQHLRGRDLHDLLWDTANGAVVCDRHHRRHHNRTSPIPKDRIPPRGLHFISEHGLADLLDRYYA